MSGRDYPSRPLLAASMAVFRDGKVLLASRTKPPALALFSLPGGLVEAGETLREAAVRELAEEVGVIAAGIEFNDHVEVIERDETGRVRRHFVIASFVGRWASGEPTAGPEAGSVLWIAPDRLGGLAVTPGLARVLARGKRLLDAAGQ